MDATHLHLVLTHFPIVGTIIGVGILIYGMLIKSITIKKLSLVILVIMSVLTIPVFLTGEAAEEKVEQIAGVSENLIEEHEEIAEKAIWFMGGLGIFSILTILLSINKNSIASIATLITFIISLVTVGLFVQVGNLGGQIRHTEIHQMNHQLNDSGKDNQNVQGRSEIDDDD